MAQAQSQTSTKAQAPKGGKKARQVAAGTVEGKKAKPVEQQPAPEAQPEFHERREGDRRADQLAQGDRVMAMLAHQKAPELCPEQKKMQEFQNEMAALAQKFGVPVEAVKVKGVKTPRADRMQQNGITRPAPETTCGKIWALADAISLQTHTVATIAAIRAHESMKPVNDHTIKTQYARWRQYNNVSGRLPRVHAVQQTQGEYAGLAPMVTPPQVPATE